MTQTPALGSYLLNANLSEIITPRYRLHSALIWLQMKIKAVYGISIEEWEKRTGRKLSDDFYKRKLPTKQTSVPMASTKTAGFGGV